MKTFSTAFSIVLAAALAGGCATAPALRCAAGETASVDDALYFGLARPRGAVGPDEWAAFLRDVVTPRFPDGLSSWPVAGQWRTASGTIVREDSVIVSIVHADDATSEAAVRAIVDDYKRRFAQDAVLRVKRRACTSL